MEERNEGCGKKRGWGWGWGGRGEGMDTFHHITLLFILISQVLNSFNYICCKNINKQQLKNVQKCKNISLTTKNITTVLYLNEFLKFCSQLILQAKLLKYKDLSNSL